MPEIVQSTSPESTATVRDFLSSHHSGILVTADTGGAPHGAVVYYTLDNDFSLLIGTKSETQKYKNIEENAQVAFIVYDEAAQTTIQLQGRAIIISDQNGLNSIVNAMYSNSAELSHRVLPPVEKLIAGEYTAIRIVPQSIKFAVYARPDSEDDDMLETVLFA